MKWLPCEEQILRAKWPVIPVTQIAKQLNRTVPAVRSRASKLNLKTSHATRKRHSQMRAYTMWSSGRDKLLTNNYGRISDEALAEQLGCTVSALLNRTAKIGARKANAWGVRND